MTKISKKNKEVLIKNKVGLAILFGSQLSGLIHPGSDFDIGIVFEDKKLRRKNPTKVYGELYQMFSEVFGSKNLDIVYLEEAPLSLQFNAIHQGKVIFSSSLKFLADYKEKTILRYFDFKPVEEYFKKVFLAKVS